MTKEKQERTTTWVKYEFSNEYKKKLREYYSLPWYKRLFKKPPFNK